MVVAELTKWNGEVEKREIPKECAFMVAYAVEGQYTVFDKQRKFGINGADYKHVDVYEVAQ